MGRPQKHIDHPLYKLRLLLSDTGQAVTQPELSRLVDIPLPTLQSIGCGRRGWTPDIRSKISQMIWAVWDETNARWLFKHSVPPKEFSYQLFEQYRQFIFESAPIPQTDPETLKMRIDALFERVSKDSWMTLYWRLQDCLEECRQDFELKELEELFEAAQDQIHFSPGVFTGPSKALCYTAKPLQRTYRFTERAGKQLKDYLRAYYKKCAEHYKALSKRESPVKIRSDIVRLDK
jgi:hypothetical protein